MTSVLLLLLLAADVPQAKPDPLPAAASQPLPGRVGIDVLQRRLTLAEAIEMALKNNLDIEIERTNTASAAQFFRGAKGYLDPVLRFSPILESRNTPTASVLQGADGKLSEHFFTPNFAFRQKTPWSGLQFAADFENSRQSSSNPFTTLSPFTTSRLTLSLTQPLFRGREIDNDRAQIRIRRKNMDLSEIDFEIRAIDVVTRTQSAYWDLVASRQDVIVQTDSVELAREQLARSRRLIDAGSLAPVELSAAEAELQRRLDTLYSAIGQVTEVENQLKTLLAGDRKSPLWSEEILPADQRITTPEPPEIYNLQETVTTALAGRPELRSVRTRREVNDVEKKLNADLTKAQVNLVAAYTNSGLAGTFRAGDNPFTASNEALYDRVNRLSAQSGLPPVAAPSFGALPDSVLGGYGTALSSLFSGRFQSAQVGLQFDFTARNRAAESNLAQSVITERRLKLLEAQAEQTIEAQVRNALQAIQTTRQRIAAAGASARAAREKLDSEIRLFQTGESTNFLVLTRQNELVDSRRREVVARLDFNKAVARLEQAQGTTLKDHNVALK